MSLESEEHLFFLRNYEIRPLSVPIYKISVFMCKINLSNYLVEVRNVQNHFNV